MKKGNISLIIIKNESAVYPIAKLLFYNVSSRATRNDIINSSISSTLYLICITDDLNHLNTKLSRMVKN